MRVGLLGAGRIGALHGSALRDHPAVTEIVVTDVDAGRAAALARTLGATSVPTVDDAFAARLDAAVICAATPAHAQLLRRACDARVPVFCEKPIAMDLVETAGVVEHAERSGTPVQIGFQRRFDAGMRALREEMTGGRLGTVQVIRMVSSDAEMSPIPYLKTSGGIFRDMHVHDFDVLRWLTGAEPVDVYAAGSAVHPEVGEIGDADTTAVVLQMDDGVLVTVSGARENGAGYDTRVEVSGTKRTLIAGLDARAPLASVEHGGRPAPSEPYVGFVDRFGPAYRAEIDTFLKVVRGEQDSPCVPRDALEALRIALACDLSRAEGRAVKISEVV